MASSIIPETIDESFPVAGVDNDTQGFRDNFSIIKTNFEAARDEIVDLQDTAARLNADNSFDYNTNSKVNLNEITKEYNNSASGDIDVELSFTGGHFYFVDDVISGGITVTLKDWPTNDQYAEMFVQVRPATSDPTTVTFASKNPSGTASQYYVDQNAAWTGREITLDNAITTSDVVKAWTTDNGVTVYFEYIGQFTQTA